MLQMAADAVFSRGIVHLHFEVIAMLGGKILGYFLVALKTLEGRRAGAERVAGIALRSAGQRRVRLGKWAGRNLGMSGTGNEQTDSEEQEREEGGPFEEPEQTT